MNSGAGCADVGCGHEIILLSGEHVCASYESCWLCRDSCCMAR